MPRTIPTVTAALAALALAAPAASATPIDDPIHTSTVVATTAPPTQDLRSPDARDAATRPAPATRTLPSSPTSPACARCPNGPMASDWHSSSGPPRSASSTAVDRVDAATRPDGTRQTPRDAARHRTPAEAAALAQARYYSSYGQPEPITAPAAPPPASGTPWLTIALAATLALVAASIAAILRRRLRLRRRVVRATT